MSDLLVARALMGLSLAFHILFAVAGIAMPLLMVLAEARWLRTRDPVCLELAHRWARGTAILFAVGAVSGTVLSFELGLLWPRFMAWAGPVIGMPFSMEGFAFFLEAVFIGIYFYGWERVPERAHLLAGVVVAISGALSGVFVVCANAWMNTPAGFELRAGRPLHIRPFAAMWNPSAPQEVLHMALAAYVAVGFVVAAIHARALLRDPSSRLDRRALAIAFSLAALCAPLQLLSGDLSARFVAGTQPAKLAAMEGQWETQRAAPLRIGGLPDDRAERTRGSLEIPGGLSLLAYGDPGAEVRGLKSFPHADRPPAPPVHLAFQLMVGCGSLLAGVAIAGATMAARSRGMPRARWFLRLLVACGPLGLLAIEAGWVVTEMGRQPWIIQGVQRTADAVTPVRGLLLPFGLFMSLYAVLGLSVIHLLRRQVILARVAAGAGDAPHGGGAGAHAG